MLFPTKIVVIYCPEWRSKSWAIKSNNGLCLRSISSRKRFLLKKAISIPEKKADKSNIMHMIIMEFIKSADSIILRGLIYRFSGSSSDIARCSELRNGLIGPLLSVFCLVVRTGRGIGFNSP